MNTPGFSAEVVLDPAIQHRHYGGLFAGTSDQSGVTPQLSIADIIEWIFGAGGAAAGGAVGKAIGDLGGTDAGNIGGGAGAIGGFEAGRAVGREVNRQRNCISRTGRFCD